MRRWAGPLAVAVLAGLGAWFAVLHWIPDVVMARAVTKMAERGGWNRFLHAPPVRAEAQTIVRPSPDLLYSSCAFDLASGPLEITAVPVPDHYSSISVFDGRTDVVFVRNDQQMAGQTLRLFLALAGQRVPDGVDVVRLNAPRGVVLQRVLLADPDEAAVVDPVRRQATCGTWNGQAEP